MVTLRFYFLRQKLAQFIHALLSCHHCSLPFTIGCTLANILMMMTMKSNENYDRGRGGSRTLQPRTPRHHKIGASGGIGPGSGNTSDPGPKHLDTSAPSLCCVSSELSPIRSFPTFPRSGAGVSRTTFFWSPSDNKYECTNGSVTSGQRIMIHKRQSVNGYSGGRPTPARSQLTLTVRAYLCYTAVKWHQLICQMTQCGSRFFLYTVTITFVSISEFNMFKCSHFLNSFELLGNRKKLTLIFTVIVFTINCKTKTILASVNKCTVTTSGSQRHCVT